MENASYTFPDNLLRCSHQSHYLLPNKISFEFFEPQKFIYNVGPPAGEAICLVLIYRLAKALLVRGLEAFEEFILSGRFFASNEWNFHEIVYNFADIYLQKSANDLLSVISNYGSIPKDIEYRNPHLPI